ncbi:MAG: four helix bundle protein [candidate division Zixibacteria bacterium]|nr:four helix bundle protein [candidate division Zixibacteria bacterium]
MESLRIIQIERKLLITNYEWYVEGRTKAFAIRIIRMYAVLPKRTEAQIRVRQILCRGTSAGAHCREAKRARSKAEFVSKLEVGIHEFEETRY